MDMESLASSLKGNPMLQQAMAANPEMQELLNNPAALQEKMAEMQQLMNSDEGREASAKIMAAPQVMRRAAAWWTYGCSLGSVVSQPWVCGVAALTSVGLRPE